MKALIYNSGIGNRMGEFTKSNHKSMVRLSNGETIFGRQLRLLRDAGVTDVVVTTGPFEEQLRDVAAGFPDLAITYVSNEKYAETNYIYSMHRAADQLDDDLLLLHGDLVFNEKMLDAVLEDPRQNLGAINEEIAQPVEDFKARIDGSRITEVAVDIHDSDCVAFQPLYKLSKEAVALWLAKVAEFIEAGTDSVYAENALNELLEDLEVEGFSYADHFVSEIDTLEDREKHAATLRDWDYREQKVVKAGPELPPVTELLQSLGAHKPLVVGGKTFEGSALKQELDANKVDYVVFSGYSENPKLEEVRAGLETFASTGRDSVIALGGGSAMDVAKGVKLLAAADSEDFPAYGDPLDRRVPQIFYPTTAGTGSESTHFAVVYVDGEKHSIAHDAALPEYAILDPELLRTLPEYHRNSSLLDALAQAVESLWAKGATEQSKEYARAAIETILESTLLYTSSDAAFDEELAASMLEASNLAGKAINISKTTAAHAMSYGLTAETGIAHGHAAALCLVGVWGHHLEVAELGGPGSENLRESLDDIAQSFGVETPEQALELFRELYADLRMPDLGEGIDAATLAAQVNTERLGNNPVPLSEDVLTEAYRGLA